MARKRYSIEQIVAKLREPEKMEAQGLTVAQRCNRLGMSDQTFLRWRIKYCALKEDEAHRPKALGTGEQPPEEDRRALVGELGARRGGDELAAVVRRMKAGLPWALNSFQGSPACPVEPRRRASAPFSTGVLLHRYLRPIASNGPVQIIILSLFAGVLVDIPLTEWSASFRPGLARIGRDSAQANADNFEGEL